MFLLMGTKGCSLIRVRRRKESSQRKCRKDERGEVPVDSSRNRDWNMRKHLVVAFMSSALMFLLAHEISAQTTVTSTPSSVDMANPSPVVLQVQKPDGSSDSGFLEQVQSVKVGGQPAGFHKDLEGITITPPKLSSGTQPVQLLDKDNKEIAKGELRYQSTADQRSSEERRRDQLVGYTWYYFLVTLMFLAVLLPFILAIYRGTSGSRATDNRPLGLPVGSFRSILAYSLVAYLGFYVLTSILSVSQFAPPDFLLGIIATVIGFYFGSRSGDEGEAGLKTGTVRGIVRQGTNPVRGAIVKFKRSADGAEPYSRISDLDGRFELRGASPGKYKVNASLAGSASSEEQEVSIVEGSDHEIEIIIKSAVPPPQPPAQTGTVQGAVTKPDGSPAPQASVVFSQGGNEKFKKTTDNSGRYKIDTITAGEYEVGASLAQYNPSDITKVKVISGGQHTVDLKLK